MKKAVLPAIISTLLATSAQAANVYNAEGTTADIYGRMQFDIHNDGSETDGVGSARIGFKTKSPVTEATSAIARAEWQIEAENSTSDSKQFKVRHLYAGLKNDNMGQLIFGQTYSAFYQAVAATDIYNTYGYATYNNVDTGRQEGQVIYSGEFAGVSVGASYQFQDQDVTPKLDNAYAFALGYNIAGVALDAAYSVEQFESAEDKNNYAFSATYQLDDLYLAAVYAGSDQENVAAYQGYDLLASYALSAAKVYGGYTFQENTDADSETFNAVTLGAQYALNKNMKTWIEYKADMITDNDDAWTVAIQYNF